MYCIWNKYDVMYFSTHYVPQPFWILFLMFLWPESGRILTCYWIAFDPTNYSFSSEQFLEQVFSFSKNFPAEALNILSGFVLEGNKTIARYRVLCCCLALTFSTRGQSSCAFTKQHDRVYISYFIVYSNPCTGAEVCKNLT